MSTSLDPLIKLKMSRPGIIPEYAWNAIVDAIKTCRIGTGLGYRVRSMFGLGTTLQILPDFFSHPTFVWEIHRSIFSGEGSPPGDQARRVRLRRGNVNNLIPSNMDQEFTIPASSENYKVYLAASLTWGSGFTVTSLSIGTGAAVPTTEGDQPPIVYRLLGEVATDSSSVTSMFNQERLPLTLTGVQTFWDCTSSVQSAVWGYG